MSSFESRKAVAEPLIMKTSDNLVILKIGEDDHVWWSPEMNLRVEDQGESSKLFEVIGPNPSVFTLAMFFIILGSVSFTFAAITALSLMSLGNSPGWTVTASIASILLVVIALATLAYGRKQAKDQVEILRAFIAASLPG